MCGIKLGKRKPDPEPDKPAQDNHTQSVINSAEGSTTQSVVVNVGSPVGGYNNVPRDFVQGPKSKVVAALLAFFLGGLGIHKFYLGYNTAGIIILLISLVGGLFTFGIASIVISILTFIEFFIYLTMTDETFEATVCRGTRPWF
jgi:TM2 domain-containing membrane protein YozV